MSDLGFEPEDATSMPWWRRGRKSARRRSTPRSSASSTPTSIEPSDEFDIDLLDELDRAEDAVKRFTGEVDPDGRATCATTPSRRRCPDPATTWIAAPAAATAATSVPAARGIHPRARHPAQGAHRRQRRGHRGDHERAQPVPGRCEGHRLQPRPVGHPLRDRARTRRQGRARDGAGQEPRLRGRQRTRSRSCRRSRARARSASRSRTRTARSSRSATCCARAPPPRACTR